ncbi:MAG TPA: sugar transferase [Actinobacteria bacterium]|nr:UDP-N-acetylgalactosamine-undecaprenyl-phosphate N-acetylgalactosaminephosphotransferase [bacterium BMS3Bbin01]HDH25506.1 sugar transferase [Actinomycetota bacterium]
MVQRLTDQAIRESVNARVEIDRARDSKRDGSGVRVLEFKVIDLRDSLVIDLRSRSAERLFLSDDQGILSASRWMLALKRLIDIAASVILIVLLSPVFVLAAIAVKLTSPGPILHIGDRVGKGGRVFRFAKFRSMYSDAETRLESLRHHNEASGPVFKMRRDPRITPVGKFMRKYSIDEFPQLFHVLTGQLSLVGPRPPFPEETSQYNAWHRQRLLVKPGITCIWQVSGRSDLDFETWVAMDIEYIATWSPWLDFTILLKTIPAVLSGKGAY